MEVEGPCHVLLDQSDQNNFQPITILYIPSKILENMFTTISANFLYNGFYKFLVQWLLQLCFGSLSKNQPHFTCQIIDTHVLI